MVGGGNTAVEEALYLSNIARKVYLVHRRDTLKAEKIMQDKLFRKVAEGKIETFWHHQVEEVLGNDAGVTGVRVKSTLDGGTRDIDAHASSWPSATTRTPPVRRPAGDEQRLPGNPFGPGRQCHPDLGGGVFAAGDVADQHYPTARRSPRPASAAWPHWTPSATWTAQGKAS